MTPAMHLSAIKASYAHKYGAAAICHDLERAFALGHEFGVERAAAVVDQCNREGPYNAIGAASRIRALAIEVVKPVNTIDRDFLPT
jgi:hypothetical protein